jgi:hypothetical protein
VLGYVSVLLATALLATAAATEPSVPTRVELKPTVGGVEATFILPAPVARFELEEAVEDVRADTWHVQTPGMALAQGAVSRTDGASFATFSVLVTPDSRPRDRRYPALTAIGGGWQIYGPYFKAAEGRSPIEGHVASPKGWTTAPQAKSGRVALDGYVYVGPANNIAAGSATFVTGPETPTAMRDAVAKAASQATAYYTKRLGMGLKAKPTVMIALVPGFNPGWQGDTTAGPVASLRFFGPKAAQMDSDDTDRAVQFVNHEFFHFWNSRTFTSRNSGKEAWLHEGMAEYAALLASRQAGVMSEAQVGEALSGRLTGCANALKAKGLDADPPRRGGAVYDCGVLVQWIADLQVRRASNGSHDVFDLWRALFAEAARNGGAYDGAGFLARAGLDDPAADAPLNLLMRPGGPDRWPRLAQALEGLGAKVTPTRSGEAEREALVMHVLGQVCKGGRGFYGGDPEALKLDTRDRCGMLNGDPTVDTIAGHNIMTDVQAAFDAAGPICAAQGDIVLSLKGKAVATVTCKTPMSPRPLAWTVERWR